MYCHEGVGGATLPGHFMETWDVIKVNMMRVKASYLTNGEYVVLVVDEVSEVSFGFLLRSKQAEGVARAPSQVRPTFVVPNVVWCGSAKEFIASVIEYLWRRRRIPLS